MWNICYYHVNRNVTSQILSPQKVAFSWPSMFSTCSNYNNWVNYCNRSLLKKWHYLDLICSEHVVTITTGLSYSNRSLLKKWHFLDLVCSVYVVTITSVLNYSNWSLLKKWHFLDLICAIYVVTMRIEMLLFKLSLLKKCHFLDLLCSVNKSWVSYCNRSVL